MPTRTSIEFRMSIWKPFGGIYSGGTYYHLWMSKHIVLTFWIWRNYSRGAELINLYIFMLSTTEKEHFFKNVRSVVNLIKIRLCRERMRKIIKQNLQNLNNCYICDFLAALFIIAQRWKQPKCPSTNEWMHKMWCFHTLEYYAALKSNAAVIHAIIWVNLDIMLGKRSQSQKTTFIWNAKNRQIHRHGKQIDGCQGLEGGGDGKWL